MDNLAHSLVGAAIGRAVAGERVPRAGWIGAVAANAPDWAEFFTGFPWPGAQYLAEHRGVTHAALGVVIEIAVLTAFVTLGLTWWRRRHGLPQAIPWESTLACIAAAVASHPFMDWQGSYGLRPWLPWSDRWTYGDFVAIADPLYWLVPLTALAWGARRRWPAAVGALAIALPVLYLIWTVAGVAWWLRLVCAGLCGVGVIGWVRGWIGVGHAHRAAAWALAVLALYAGAQGVASVPAKRAIARSAIARFGGDAEWAALTVVGRPFTWEAIVADDDSVAGEGWAAPRNVRLPAVQHALTQTSDGRAIARFARFLAAEVDSSGPGPARVHLRDARYQPLGRSGWATATVTVE